MRNTTELGDEGCGRILDDAVIALLVVVAVVDQVEFCTNPDVRPPGEWGTQANAFAPEEGVIVTTVVYTTDDGVQHRILACRAGKGEAAVVFVEASVRVVARMARVYEDGAFAPDFLSVREVPLELLVEA